jgi:hypothetical protein
MIDFSTLPSIFFRIIDGTNDSEEPTKLDTYMVQALISRATENLNELLPVLNNADNENETTHTTDTDAVRRPPMDIELTWDVDDNTLSQKAQDTILSLVGAGLILNLKDYVRDTITDTNT